MRRLRARSITTTITITMAFGAIVPAATSEDVAAGAGAFDPSLDSFAEPILDRLDGDDIPVDAAGLGGSMFDRLPQDERTSAERGIEADVMAALNWERVQRGLWQYTYSDHVSSVLNRWVRTISSDADDYPDCPVAVQADPPVKSCDAAAPAFEWFDFINSTNGPGSTLGIMSGGANAGATASRPGAFVAGLIAAGGLHYADVLGLDGRFTGVGVHCLPDGMTYLTWVALDYDPEIKFADPASYDGPVVPATVPTNFGRRCPQPGPGLSVGVSGSSASVTPVPNTIKLTSGRHEIEGPVLGADVSTWSIEATFTHPSAAPIVVSQPLYTPQYDFAPVVVGGLALGTWTVEVRLEIAYESTLQSVGQFEVVPQAAGAESGSGHGPASRFTPVAPYGQVDTRGRGRLAAGEMRQFTVDAPPGATAVTLNVTAVHPAADGFLQVFPCTPGGVAVSSVNYTADLPATPNQVTVGLHDGAHVCVSTYAATDVLLDVAGWWGASGTSFVSVAPTRVHDTRPSGLAAGATLRLDLGAMEPASAKAVSLNVTSTRSVASGFVTVWPCDDALPVVSNLNPSVGVDRPNHVTVELGASRQICLYTHERTDLVVDLTGWWTTTSASALRVLDEPARVYDTRSGSGPRLAAMATRAVLPQAAETIVANVTVDRPSAAGWLAVFPCDDGWSGSSNVNFRARRAASTAVLVDASRGGVCVIADQSADVIVDVFGEFA
jgi:hypothetical protein